MAIFNTGRDLNAEIRRYGSVIQREITYKKARLQSNDYDEKMEICERLISEVA